MNLFFTFAALSRKNTLPLAKIEADNTEEGASEDHGVSENGGGSAEDVVYQPESKVADREGAADIRACLDNAEGEEPDGGAGENIKRRGVGDDGSAGVNGDEHDRQPDGEINAAEAENKSDKHLDDGGNADIGGRILSLKNVLCNEAKVGKQLEGDDVSHTLELHAGDRECGGCHGDDCY